MTRAERRDRATGVAASGRTVRTRMLTTMLAFMAVGLAVTGVLAYAAQFRGLEQRVDAELWQEYEELVLIAASTEEDGTFTYSSVDALLLRATESAAPSDYESVVALIDGERAYKPNQQDFELLPEGSAESDALLEQVLAASEPGRTVTTTMHAHGRELRVLIASVDVAGDEAHGIFVVANDIGAQQRDIWRSALTFAGLSVLTLLVAGWVGYVVTGRLLRPLEDLRVATEQVTVADLEHRVPVAAGKDDIAALAQNFNRMLARIQEGFAEQRRFMSDVGHELRTPLTIVRGTLETTDVEDPADVRESRDIAIEELDRMGRVVGDLSELAASSRPDYVRPRPLDLEEFARSTFARISHIDEREWTLERTADGVAQADEQRLTQAVIQLAANAVRYSEAGTPIRFGVDRVSGPDGPEIHVSVRDEGEGIAPEDQRRIFERFVRVDGSRGSGTGLGLTIVLAIAEGHGGEVRVLSAPGRGSTFTIVFPQISAGASVDAAGDRGPGSSTSHDEAGDTGGGPAASAGTAPATARGEGAGAEGRGKG